MRKSDYLHPWFDKRTGGWRVRLRRKGYTGVEFKTSAAFRNSGNKAALWADRDFVTAYHAAMGQPLVAAAALKSTSDTFGTVKWLCVEFFSSREFDDRGPSSKKEIRRYVEDFCQHAVGRVDAIDSIFLDNRMKTMRDTPKKANKWLAAIRDFLQFAVSREVIKFNPALGVKKYSGKSKGKPRWTDDEIALAREKFPIGTMMRLCIELHLALALRRGDAIHLGQANLYQAPLSNGRMVTWIKYVQDKNHNHHDGRDPVEVKSPMPADLLKIIRATESVGLFQGPWLRNKDGNPITKPTFSRWFTREMKRAGLPAHCQPHGLRKRSATSLIDEGKREEDAMAITGHQDPKQLRVYVREYNRERAAERALGSKA